MPTLTYSHCFVQWEDKRNDFAVVHIKRAKTSFTLKVGLTTLRLFSRSNGSIG